MLDVDGKMSWKVSLVPQSTNVATTGIEPIKPQSIFTGDLEFLAMVLGREGYATWWCMYCMHYKPQWQQKPNNIMQGIDIDNLIKQHQENVSNKNTGMAMKGVKELPYLKKGTVIIFPCLHGMLGVGNAIMDYFFDEVDRFVEPITRAELAVRESIPNNNQLLEEEEHSLNLWKVSQVGGVELKKLQREIEQLYKLPQPMTLDTYNDLLDKESRVEALSKVCENMSNNITKLKEAISDAEKKLDAFRKKRKITNSSIYNGVEKIFKLYKIVRAAYHGGDFNGKNIITLMQKSEQIMSEIKEFMITHKREHTTEDDIVHLCDEVRTALVLWDDVFSKANTRYETTNMVWVNKHCDDTETSIKQAMYEMRKMGFSITPKMHGLECHLVHLMRTIPGGIHHLIEHWLEQYHQKGAEMDKMWVGHTYEHQAEFRVRRENMLNKTDTMKADARIKSSIRKVKRQRTESTLTEEDRIKEGRRLIKQEVQENIDNDAEEADMDTDGQEGNMGFP